MTQHFRTCSRSPTRSILVANHATMKRLQVLLGLASKLSSASMAESRMLRRHEDMGCDTFTYRSVTTVWKSMRGFRLPASSAIRTVPSTFIVTTAAIAPQRLPRLPASRLAMSMAKALKILERAGTSKDYAGLWRDVENYEAPSDDVELPELAEVAEVGSLAEAMAKIGRAYENLKRAAMHDGQYGMSILTWCPRKRRCFSKRASAKLHAISPVSSATNSKDGSPNPKRLPGDSENRSNPGSPVDEISRRFQMLESSCKRCHNNYRH